MESQKTEEATQLEKIVKTGILVDENNPTIRKLVKEITLKGRIPYSMFMEESLFGENGYYSAGKAKINEWEQDFHTSAVYREVSGRLSIKLHDIWRSMGSPTSFRVIEMGAGSGLMALFTLVTARQYFPDFYRSIKYTIIEYGDLIKRQQKTLTGTGFAVDWIQGSASQLPIANVEGVFISNELPDTFPVEIVKKIKGELRQKYISINNDQWVEIWDTPSKNVLDYINHYNVPIDSYEEPINLQAVQWQRQIDTALERGAIITIDYGKRGVVGRPNIKATRCYKFEKDSHDPALSYEYPGDVDITASVNFKVLEEAAEKDGLRVAYSGTQGEFLKSPTKEYLIYLKPCTKIREQIKKTTSDEELFHLKTRLKDLEKGMDLIYPKVFEQFYALCLVKGIPTTSFQTNPT